MIKMDFIYMGGGYRLDICGSRSGPETRFKGSDNDYLNSIKLRRNSQTVALLLHFQEGVLYVVNIFNFQ